MKLLPCCFIAGLLLAFSNAVDVEKTVKQVQSILQANEGLPRLSREEIIQLLNDIRAEDAKSRSSSTSTEDSRELRTTTTPRVEENEINPITQVPKFKDIKENIIHSQRDFVSASPRTTTVKSTSIKSEPSIMVVLPYTPRDGSSLQELYTRPPRVEVLPVSKVTPNPLINSLDKLQRTLKDNAKAQEKPKNDIPAELQAFLETHGLKGNPGQDNFLLPLDGFKPLPPAKVVDGTVQLPENILLTYDLISTDSNSKLTAGKLPQNNFLYEPLRPEFPFELDTSPSETKDTILPLDMPVRNYEPIDYDAVRVIPLKQGVSPLEDINSGLIAEQSKRQANVTVITVSTTEKEKTEATTASASIDQKSSSDDSPTAASAASDTGASIADLADSFGGAAPAIPGDSELPPPRKNGFYWMLDWNSFLEVGDGDTKVNIRFEPKLGDPQMFIPVNVP